MSRPYNMQSGYPQGRYSSQGWQQPQRKKGMSKGAKIGCGVAAAVFILLILPLLIFGLVFGAFVSGVDKEINRDHEGNTPDPGISFTGKQQSDIGAAPGQPISFGGMELTASPLNVKKSEMTSDRMSCTEVSIKNNTDEQKSFNEVLDWKMQLPSGEIIDASLLGQNTLGSGEIAPGGFKSGDICFENPLRTKGEYVVLYDEMMSLKDGRVGWVNKNN